MQPHEISDASIDSLLDELNRGKIGSEDRLQLDEGRRNAIKSYDNIQACPGSGKTTLVGLKLLLLSSQWHERHCGICVLTHSNVAKRLSHRPPWVASGREELAFIPAFRWHHSGLHQYFSRVAIREEPRTGMCACSILVRVR